MTSARFRALEDIMSSDSQLKQAVLDELAWEPSVDAAHVGVTAHAGVITLSGHVANYAHKQAAEKAAGRVKGVTAVAEEMEVVLPYEIHRSDEDIAVAAADRLFWDSIVPKDRVKVTVEKGWVTLSGSVDWHFQREAADQDVQRLMGVRGVANEIGIKPIVDASNVEDDIEQALHRSWYYDPNSIKVSADGGRIKLTGIVTTWNARQLAGSTAWSAPGATAVTNDISVRS
jgi:osmotically-inducible protein OsmY